MRFVITGGNGEFGRGVVEAVAARVPEARLVATVRDPERGAGLTARGIEVRPGEFDEPTRLRDAFAGADVVLVNATFFGVDPGLRGRRVENAITAAAGAGRIVLTSWPDAEVATLSAVQDYARSEELVRAAGPAWTILRFAAGLADAVGRDVSWARQDGELVAPAGDARCTPAAMSDLIDAAAVAVTGTGHENACYEITGPHAIGWSELAGLAGTMDGRVIEYRAVDDDQYRAYLAARELPGPIVDGLLALYAEFRSGWSAMPSPVLADLIGRAPLDSLQAVRNRVPA
jgi:NAD(P)H dehydrogenase (quinone)